MRNCCKRVKELEIKDYSKSNDVDEQKYSQALELCTSLHEREVDLIKIIFNAEAELKEVHLRMDRA